MKSTPLEYTLSNGLRVIYRPTQTDVTYCGFAIDAGTRDEKENEQGMEIGRAHV